MIDQSPVHLYDPIADYVNAELQRRSGQVILPANTEKLTSAQDQGIFDFRYITNMGRNI